MFLSYCLEGKTLSSAIFEIERELAHSPYDEGGNVLGSTAFPSVDGMGKIVSSGTPESLVSSRSEAKLALNQVKAILSGCPCLKPWLIQVRPPLSSRFF